MTKEERETIIQEIIEGLGELGVTSADEAKAFFEKALTYDYPDTDRPETPSSN